MEYRLRWVPGVGHVHFIFFMLISFASGIQRKLVFQWNIGIKVLLDLFVQGLSVWGVYFLGCKCQGGQCPGGYVLQPPRIQ